MVGLVYPAKIEANETSARSRSAMKSKPSWTPGCAGRDAAPPLTAVVQTALKGISGSPPVFAGAVRKAAYHAEQERQWIARRQCRGHDRSSGQANELRRTGGPTGPLYTHSPTLRTNSTTGAHHELENIVSRNNSILVVFPVLCEAHTSGASPAGVGGGMRQRWLSEMAVRDPARLIREHERLIWTRLSACEKNLLADPIYSGRTLCSHDMTRRLEGARLDVRPTLRNDADECLEVR